RQDPDGAGHLAVYAEGTAFVMLADRPPGAVEVAPTDAEWPDRSQPIEKHVRHHHTVGPDGRLVVVLARAESSQAARAAAADALSRAEEARAAHLADDARFWS